MSLNSSGFDKRITFSLVIVILFILLSGCSTNKFVSNKKTRNYNYVAVESVDGNTPQKGQEDKSHVFLKNKNESEIYSKNIELMALKISPVENFNSKQKKIITNSIRVNKNLQSVKIAKRPIHKFKTSKKDDHAKKNDSIISLLVLVLIFGIVALLVFSDISFNSTTIIIVLLILAIVLLIWLLISIFAGIFELSTHFWG